MADKKMVKKAVKPTVKNTAKTEKKTPKTKKGSIRDASGIKGTVHDGIDMSDFTPSPYFHK